MPWHEPGCWLYRYCIVFKCIVYSNCYCCRVFNVLFVEYAFSYCAHESGFKHLFHALWSINFAIIFFLESWKERRKEIENGSFKLCYLGGGIGDCECWTLGHCFSPHHSGDSGVSYGQRLIDIWWGISDGRDMWFESPSRWFIFVFTCRVFLSLQLYIFLQFLFFVFSF